MRPRTPALPPGLGIAGLIDGWLLAIRCLMRNLGGDVLWGMFSFEQGKFGAYVNRRLGSPQVPKV